MSNELTLLRRGLKRKAKKHQQKAKKSAALKKEGKVERRENLHCGEVIMVKVLTSLAPINYRGKTIHLVPRGLVVPAIRTLRGVKLLLTGGRNYEAYKKHFEYGEIKNQGVPISTMFHPEVLKLRGLSVNEGRYAGNAKGKGGVLKGDSGIMEKTVAA